MTKYKKYVEEYKISKKFPINKKYFSYPLTSKKFLNSYIHENSINNTYYTSEPSEKNENMPTYIPTYMPTRIRATYCPTNKNLTTFFPTNYINNNNNNNITTIFIISFTTIFISLCLFTAYFFKYYLKYKKIKKELKQLKQDKLDLEFGISSIEDI
jgi:uncharacterized membrane protein YciS (DUF1049 family)